MLSYDSYNTITAERRDRILTLTMNRPEQLNAIDEELHEELSRIFYDVAGDEEADVVVLTGAGNAFCAGGDLDWIDDMHGDPKAFARTVWEGKRIVNSLLDIEQPVIARLPGHAIGLGCTLALFCDIIYATDTAKIGDPHVSVGLVAGDGGAVIWPQLIGYPRAKEYLMTGDLLTAPQAAEIGLINHAVPADQLDDAVYGMAERLAGGATNAIRWTKAAVNLGLKQIANAVLDTAFNFEAMSQMTEDHKIATQAFLNKEKPKFTGR
ncbi:MAG: enoyl-CoA hydratase/isomerase family protein [Alphaproteobacteria bacterium]|nr:enoyl-CoA hydratase/isomerase family protein [Alphaproteobacteria bacterium]